MKINIGEEIKGTNYKAKMDVDTLIFNFSRSLVLSNAFYNGGLQYTEHLINHSLNGKKDCGGEPVEYMNTLLAIKKLPMDTVALMTAVLPENFFHGRTDYGDVFLSMGLDNASNPLDDFGYPGFGTINIIVLINSKITSNALVDLYKSITELKSYFIMEHRIKSSRSQLPATGTFTDVTALVSGTNSPEFTYSGPATKLSYNISRCLYDLMEEAIKG